jgi:DNA/RNA endonuclease G (NUC1)
MVPNADMRRSESAMINTYMFSNMAPQHGSLDAQSVTGVSGCE